MSDINIVAITGRLTCTPELRRTKAGLAVTTLRVAVQRRKGRKNQDRGAVFWDAEVWDRKAEACCQYLSMGKRIAVEGHLDQSEWEKDGQRRYRNFISADHVHFLDPRDRAGSAPAPDGKKPDEEDIPF